MIIKILAIQREERYEGQYGIEVTEAVDEYSYSDNPEWIHDRLKEAQEATDITVAVLVDIEVKEEDIKKKLFPNTEPIDGAVK